MERSSGRNFWTALALALFISALAGCGGGGLLSSPFAPRTPEPDFATPAERAAELLSRAEGAASASPEQQEAVAHELAMALRNEPDPIIRADIIRVMGALQAPTATRTLEVALNDPDVDVQLAACEAWGKRNDSGAVARLGEALESNNDIDVRLAAARALGQTGSPAAIQALGGALEDPDPALQLRAVDSLRKLSDVDFGNDVVAWQQYVRGETPRTESQPSIARRLRELF